MPQGAVHIGPHPHPSGPREAVHRGGGRLQHRGGGHTLSVRPGIPRFTPVPFTPTDCPRPSATTTLGTRSCSQSSWRWRSGDNGWRGLRCRFMYGPIRRTWSTYRLPSGSSRARLGGSCSSPGLIFIWPTDLGRRM